MTINHIAIPPQFVAIAGKWYGGQGCMLYAVSSTGGLTTGTIRPRNDSDGCPCTDEQWYYNLWAELSSDVGRAESSARKMVAEYADCQDELGEGEYDEYAEDSATLAEFEEWVDNNVLPRLESEYADCEGFEA